MSAADDGRPACPEAEAAAHRASPFRAALGAARTQKGESILDASMCGPVLLVFLRHFG